MNTSHKKNNLLKQNLKNNHAQKRIDSSAIINLFINLFTSSVIRTPLRDWWFTTPCKQKVRAKKVSNKIRKKTDWIKGSEKITQKLENIKTAEDTIELVVFSINKTEITIFSINKIEIVKKKLEQLYSEDPLKGWEKHKTTIKIELIDKNSIL